MAGISLKWTGGTRYVAADEAGHEVVTDVGSDGFKPPALLLVSLAGCAGVDVVQILEKQRQTFTGIEVSVSQENAPEPPWTITKIHTDWVVRGVGLKKKAVERAVRLSLEKYCSVSASLTSELVTTVHVVEEETGEGEA